MTGKHGLDFSLHKSFHRAEWSANINRPSEVKALSGIKWSYIISGEDHILAQVVTAFLDRLCAGDG